VKRDKAAAPAKIAGTAREFSAGGVVLQQISGTWYVALIEPQRTELAASSAETSRKTKRAVMALPKGLIDTGEKPSKTAAREVHEETGIVAEVITKLADNKYVYVRKWGDGARVFKVVSFYLMRYASGEVDELTPDMRVEVKQALWVPLDEAATRLEHSSERKVLKQAQEMVRSGVLE
jgi:ADP-ribose pyrophosphatase YjhB (NUDIX family)